MSVNISTNGLLSGLPIKLGLVAIIVAALTYLLVDFKPQIAMLFAPNYLDGERHHIVEYEKVVQYTDDDIFASEIWKLNTEQTHYHCILNTSVLGYDFCNQQETLPFNTHERGVAEELLENGTRITMVTKDHPVSAFRAYWEIIGKDFYIVHFSVGHSVEYRRTIFTYDINDAREGRLFTSRYTYIIEQLKDERH